MTVLLTLSIILSNIIPIILNSNDNDDKVDMDEVKKLTEQTSNQQREVYYYNLTGNRMILHIYIYIYIYIHTYPYRCASSSARSRTRPTPGRRRSNLDVYD